MNKMFTAAWFLATSLMCALAPVASYILCHQGVQYRPHMSLCRFTNAEPGSHRPMKCARMVSSLPSELRARGGHSVGILQLRKTSHVTALFQTTPRDGDFSDNHAEDDDQLDESVKEAFGRVDSDGDGWITRDQIKAALEELEVLVEVDTSDEAFDDLLQDLLGDAGVTGGSTDLQGFFVLISRIVEMEDMEDSSEEIEQVFGSGKWAFIDVNDVQDMDVEQIRAALAERGLSELGNFNTLQARLISTLTLQHRDANVKVIGQMDEELFDGDPGSQERWRRQTEERWGSKLEDTSGEEEANVSNAKGNASNGTGTEEVQVIFKVEGTNEDKKTLLERNFKIEMAWFTPYTSLPGWRPAGVFTPKIRRGRRNQDATGEEAPAPLSKRPVVDGLGEGEEEEEEEEEVTGTFSGVGGETPEESSFSTESSDSEEYYKD